MRSLRKLKGRRGITLVEVLLVVALIAALLGIAAPNLLSERREIKLAELNGNARAVAVAVQSKLYGMKSAGTAKDSVYYTLTHDDASIAVTIQVQGEKKELRLLSNFACRAIEKEEETPSEGSGSGDDGTLEKGDDYKPLEYTEKQASKARALVLSGALTDIELLEKGKIIVVFDPDTANVIEVFYGESEFYTEYLIPEANDPWMEQNMIGYYLGLYAPTPERRPALPHFSYAWKYDDELYLELKMLGTPDQTLLNKPLGLEVFARIPKVKKDGESSGAGSGSDGVQKVTEWDEILIYGEGYFASNYETTYATDTYGQKTIQADYNGGSGLTLAKIQKGGGKLKFALDSMVIDKANYDNKDTKSKLHHSANPTNISVTEGVLYPRNSLADWLNPRRNPYLTVGMREHSKDISQELTSLITKEATNGANPTDFVKVTQGMSLHIKLHVLSDQPRDAKGSEITGSGNGARLYDFDDDHYVPFEVTAQTISPYFYALSDSANKATLSSIRDFNNLAYVFQSENKITEADLDDDISGQKFYEKLTSVRYALIDKYKDESIKSAWGHGANWDGVAVQQMYIENKKSGFTLSGKKPNGDGNYSIIDIAGGGRNYDLGGFFGYAENCTFKDLDIVNPVIWRNSYETTFIKTDDESGKISELNITKYPGGASGALVGVAVNCTFENVKVYIDSYHTTSITTYEDKPELRTLQNIPPHRVSGVVSGGIVGIAIGGTDTIDTSSVKATAETKGCTFKNCAVSHNVSSEFYNPAGSCVYAGGFVGIAMGDVTIQNCYAASQVYGYYASGLVGAAANGSWSYKENGTEIGKGEAKGTLAISNSFAAGYIMHGVHVGAGLIAEVQDKEKVKVTNCYSTVGWDAFPPVAYGTFEGDEANYYVFPTKINLPLTVNIEAHFTCTGDIFSLQNGTTEGTTTGKCGIGCTEKELIKKLTEGESKDKWEKNATRTQQWKWRESQAPFYYEDGYTDVVHEDWGYLKSVKYPYPMPKGNDKFWGSWIEETCCDSEDEKTPKQFSATFDGYFITYYERNVAEFGRMVDAGNIKTVDQIYIEGDKAMMGGQPLSETWWANTAGWTGTFGQGKDGATDVSVDGDKLKFFGPAFYIKGFDPLKGYQFSPITKETTAGGTAEEKINLGNSQILWDFYGFYCLADCGSTSDIETKYYFKFDTTQGKGTATKGTDTHDVGRKFKDITVNDDEFREAAHWATFEFERNTTSVTMGKDGTFTTNVIKRTITWDNDHFAMTDGTKTGGTEFKASTASGSEGVGA